MWKLVNAGARPMDRLHIEMPESAEPLVVDAHGVNVILDSWDRIHRIGIWRLAQPLPPGATLELETKSGVRFKDFEEKPFEGTVGEDTDGLTLAYCRTLVIAAAAS